MQKVVVAGGAGFIGYHLCKRLLDEGYQVVSVDNLISGSSKNAERLKSNTNYTFINRDVTTSLDSLQEIKNAYAYFHLASPASPNKKSPISYINNPIETLLSNSIGTYNLLEEAKRDNAIFIYASTSEVYGSPTVSPQKEDYWGNVNPNGVRSVYDEGKRFGEAIVMAYHRKYEMDTRIARIFNTYGEYMQEDDGRVVSNFIVQALANQPLTIYGDGSQTRSFSYVSDLVEGLFQMMKNEKAKGQVINLGNPEEHTILDIAIMIKQLTGSESSLENEELPEDDPMQRRPDITRAGEILSWTPKVGLEDGLKKTIEYFKKRV